MASMAVVQILWLAILVTVWSSSVVESKGTINETNYITFDATPSGCEDMPDIKSHVHCAVTCMASDSLCPAFSYELDTCKICFVEKMLNLTFRGEQFYFPRMYQGQGANLDTQLPAELNPGNVIYFRVTQRATNMSITFMSYFPYYQVLVLAPLVNERQLKVQAKIYATSIYETQLFATPFLFLEGDTIEGHVLLTPTQFAIYVNKMLCCYWDYQRPVQEIDNIVFFNVDVQVLSF